VLSRRLGGLDLAVVVRTAVRCLAAAIPPALVAALLVAGVVRLLGDGTTGSLAALLVGAAVLGGGYLLVARRLRVTEVDDVVGPVLARLGR
jgi:putative peptidoglycan lipid II flippase